MKRNLNTQAARNLYLSIGIILLCNACMVTVPLPSRSQPTSENQAEATQDNPCLLGDALEESMDENLSEKRDLGASGFAFSGATSAAAIADPTGVVRAARTGFGLYQTGKVAADTHQNHDDCVTKHQNLPEEESESDPDNDL